MNSTIYGNSLFRFGHGVTDGDANMSSLLGGKGAHLAEMARSGLPVPRGVTIPTTVCEDYYATSVGLRPSYIADYVDSRLMPALDDIATEVGHMPLFAVRSGSPVSMPGMMDTLLNVGLTQQTMMFWIERIGERATYDCWERFLYMYATTALGIDEKRLMIRKEKVLTALYGDDEPPKTDGAMRQSVKHLKKLTEKYLRQYRVHKEEPGMTLRDQMCVCVESVMKSWHSDRAKAYRKKYKVSETLYTAVNIQSMVFGNLNDKSCSGVLFTRNPATGEPGVVGEFLPNAQGEDVVAGVRTPLPLSRMEEWNPEVHHELMEYAHRMESHYRDMQDMEFTVEDGKLFVLQTRSGKRSTRAKFRIAHDLLLEGLLVDDDVRVKISGDDYYEMSGWNIPPDFKQPPDVVGIGGSVGVGIGTAVFTSAAAVAAAKNGERVILIRPETAPNDFEGMDAAMGILTAQGGQTSHAAVVARGMNKPCVVGVTAMKVEAKRATIETDVATIVILPGDTVSICGATGRVWVGVEVPVVGGGDEYADRLLARLAQGHMARMAYGEWSLACAPDVWLDTMDLTAGTADEALRVLDYAATVGGLKTLILDLSRGIDVAFGDDPLLALVGDDTPNGTGGDPVLDAMLHLSLNGLKSLAVLFLPERLGPRVAELSAAGWNVSTPVKTLAELMKVSHAVLTPEFFTSVGGEDTAKELLEIMKLAGRPVGALTEGVYRSRLVYEVFRG